MHDFAAPQIGRRGIDLIGKDLLLEAARSDRLRRLLVARDGKRVLVLARYLPLLRATFIPCSPSGMAQPTMTSPISCGSTLGTCASTPFSTCASMSSGRTLRNIPRGAFPTGVRTAATM